MIGVTAGLASSIPAGDKLTGKDVFNAIVGLGSDYLTRGSGDTSSNDPQQHENKDVGVNHDGSTQADPGGKLKSVLGKWGLIGGSVAVAVVGLVLVASGLKRGKK